MALATHIQPSGHFAHAMSVVRETIAVFGAAVRAGSAVERRVTPARRDLLTLGIAPESLPKL